MHGQNAYLHLLLDLRNRQNLSVNSYDIPKVRKYTSSTFTVLDPTALRIGTRGRLERAFANI
jgi:hypothetical protein